MKAVQEEKDMKGTQGMKRKGVAVPEERHMSMMQTQGVTRVNARVMKNIITMIEIASRRCLRRLLPVKTNYY